MRVITMFQACGLLLAVTADLVASSALHYPNDRRQSGNTTWSGATCRDVVIPVHVSKSAPGNYSESNYDINILYALAARETLAEADYNISARICDPASGVTRQDTVQILVHGATFNKHMWDFPYQPEKYSWTKRMTEAGYTTVAVDLVGAGNSSFPNGLLEAQTETYVQVMHEVVQKVRAGEFVGRQFKQIAFVGFSIGGIVANAIADKFPDDVDVFVLIGISWDISWIYPAFLAGLQTSANVIDPVNWGNFSSYYQTQPTLAAREVACFFGEYDTQALETDFATRDFDTLGAAVTFTYHLVEAPKSSAPVFLGIGSNDATFCGGRVCGSQPYAVYDKFPAATDHVVRVYENTGHAVMYHHSGPVLMDDVEAFLTKHKP